MVNMDNLSYKESITDQELTRATHLSLVEIIFGSIGHGFKIPMTGQFLSLYQLNVLANSLNKDLLPRSSTVEISGIVAVLKSLSPAGQKLGPMLSILSQGTLFWLGTLIGGMNLFGQILGATLLSFWSFIQPLITYTLIFGFDLFRMLEFYREKNLNEYPFAEKFIIGFVLTVIFIKVCLAWLVVFFSFFKKKEWTIQTLKFEYVLPGPSSKVENSIWKKALRDTFNPLFIFSFVLMVIFLWQIETDLSRIIWLSLRPLAIAYLIFYLFRSPVTSKYLQKLTSRSKSFKRFHEKASAVIQSIENRRDTTKH